MKTTNKILCLSIFSILFISCETRYLYMPTKHNVLPFKEKGDVTFGLITGTKDNFGVEAGYAFSDNIGISTTLQRMDISSPQGTNYLFNDYLWDTELTLYKISKHNLIAGFNLGAGLGKFDNYNSNFHYDYSRQYILPWVGYKNNFTENKNMFIYYSFSGKFSRNNYKLQTPIDLSTQYDRDTFHQYFGITDPNIHRLKLETAYTIGVVFEQIHFQYQFQTLAFSKNQKNVIPTNMQLSVSLYLNNLFEKNSKK